METAYRKCYDEDSVSEVFIPLILSCLVHFFHFPFIHCASFVSFIS